MSIKLSMSVQYVDDMTDWSSILTRPMLRRWVRVALQQDARLTLRFVSENEGRTLNRDFRGKDYATNVLTFAYNDADEFEDLPEEVRGQLLADLGAADDTAGCIEADLVFCGAVLQREADERGISVLAHAAHLVVHGVLHAQGFDHIEDEEAMLMETLEVQILDRLGFDNPYATDELGDE